MKKLISSSIFAAAVAITATFTAISAHAGELDNEKSVTNQQIQMAKDLPATLVMRVDQKTGAVQALHSIAKLPADAAAIQAIAGQTFAPVDLKAQVAGRPVGELDQSSSSSSWYFCFPQYNWFAPSYYYGGFNYGYTPYFNYGFGGYNYSFYRWNYGGWY